MTKAAVLFPGQGSQEPMMGRDIAESRSETMELWIRAEKKSNIPLREIFWEAENPAQSDTRNLQPAMTVVNLCLWSLVGAKIKPSFLAGHSLGEFSALAAAGILSTDDTLELVALRGRLMAEAGQAKNGAMAAILKLDQPTVEDLVNGIKQTTNKILLIANYNSPGQLVISGEKQAVDKACELTTAQKGRAVVLPVSGAFHSPLMQEAATEFTKVLKKMTWNDPKIPVNFNVTAKPEHDPAVIQQNMARQMTSSVLWIQTLENQWQEGVRKWVELGPKGVLHRLLGQNFKTKTEPWEGENVNNLAGADNWLKSA